MTFVRDSEGVDAPPRRTVRAPMQPDSFTTITDLAKSLKVTPRAIRFYEDKGLIAPQRIGTTRVYTNRERARMVLILRGKRLGFSLREIKDYLDLYDADPRRVTQTRALLGKISERRTSLLEQREAIEEALAGLDDLERDANSILVRAGARRDRTKV